MGRYFGTNGIRGVPGRGFFTLDFVCDMTAAIGTHMMQSKKSDHDSILVGYDGRATGPLLCNAVSAALSYEGVNCTIAGMTSTPCLEYEVKKHHMGGIMITASHNPSEYNGIKAVASDGIEISRADEDRIEKRYEEKNTLKTRSWGSITRKSEFLYIQDVTSRVDSGAIRASKLYIIIDSGNGVQGTYAEQMCKKLGCRYKVINGKVDGRFPGRGPEPTPENLSQLSKAVTENGADLGIAFDGDGDRSVFCDEKGAIVIGDRSALILAKHILGKKENSGGGALIATCLNSSSSAETVASQLGAEVIRTKVGSVEVSQCMRDTGAVLGYEENGGFMYRIHNAVRDGCMTLALMLEALAYSDCTLSQHAGLLPPSYTAKTKVRCQEAADVLGRIRGMFDISDDRDGLKIIIKKPNGAVKNDADSDRAGSRWVLIRPSGTEPALRVYAEAPTQQEADMITREYAGMLLEHDGVSAY